MFEGLVSGEKYPEQISRELHSDAKACFRSGSNKYSPGFIGWVGFMATYRGTFFGGGYLGIPTDTKGKPRDYIAEAVRGVMRQLPKLHGVEFRTGGLQEPTNSR